jgi:hypothetical protein
VRLDALHALKVLDTAPEADFDDIVELASAMCGAPVSLVTLVDAERVWFKARVGVPVEETSRDVSFCTHAILGRDLMVIPDATADARFADNPYVAMEAGIRFYAGAPLLTSDGWALGTLCVVDHAPHRLDLDQLRALRALARQVAEHLELRRWGAVQDQLPNPHEVDLAYLADARVSGLRPIAAARGVAITLAAPMRVPVWAEPHRLAQALDYVVFTALKVAPVGGRIAIRVGARPVPTLEVSHAGGSIAPAWLVDLSTGRLSTAPVPAATATVLRAHGATAESVPDRLGLLDARFRINFPVYAAA